MMALIDSDKEAQAISEHLSRLTRLLGSLASKAELPKARRLRRSGLARTAGERTFHAGNRQVKGEWHLSKSFLDSLLH